jgi:tetratricopeptide (TPR) repeat protein
MAHQEVNECLVCSPLSLRCSFILGQRAQILGLLAKPPVPYVPNIHRYPRSAPIRPPITTAAPRRAGVSASPFKVVSLQHALHNPARNLLRIGDLKGAASLVQEGLTQCGDRDASAETWSLRVLWGSILQQRGLTEEALDYLTSNEALSPPDPGDITSLVRLKNQIGHCLAMLGRFASAQRFLREAERIASDAGLLELRCEVHRNQAMLFFLQEDYVSSDRVFRMILDEADRIGGWYFRAVALWGIGKNLMIRGHHVEAIPWLEDALHLFESPQAHLWIATVWGELAVCYLGLGEDSRALELFQSALNVEAEAGTVGNYQVHLANIGNVYLQRGNHLTAIDYYRRALVVAEEIKDPVSIRKWSYNIRLAYARLFRSVNQLDSL